jgi:hypothetical protein
MGRFSDAFGNASRVILPDSAFDVFRSTIREARDSLNPANFASLFRTLGDNAETYIESIRTTIATNGFAKIAKQGGQSGDFIIATNLKNGDFVPDVAKYLQGLKDAARNGTPTILRSNNWAFVDVGDDLFRGIPDNQFNIGLTPSSRQVNIPPTNTAIGNATDIGGLQKSLDDFMNNVPWYKTKKYVITGAIVVVTGVAVGIGLNELGHFLAKKRYKGSIKQIERKDDEFILKLDPKMPKLNSALFQNTDKVGVEILGTSAQSLFACLQATYENNYVQTSNRSLISIYPTTPGECSYDNYDTYTDCNTTCGTVTIQPGNIVSLIVDLAKDAAEAAAKAAAAAAAAAARAGKNILDDLFGDSFFMISGFSICCVLTIAVVFIFIVFNPMD